MWAVINLTRVTLKRRLGIVSRRVAPSHPRKGAR